MFRETQRTARMMLGGTAVAAMLCAPQLANAQWTALSRIEPGTTVQVRTTEAIDAADDGWACVYRYGRKRRARYAGPSGDTSRRDRRARRAPWTGQRARARSRLRSPSTTADMGSTPRAIGSAPAASTSVTAELAPTRKRPGTSAAARCSARFSARVIGGGDGAAAGAAAGAAVGAGAQILTKGRRVQVPAEALLSYRLQSGARSRCEGYRLRARR